MPQTVTCFNGHNNNAKASTPHRVAAFFFLAQKNRRELPDGFSFAFLH
jgi:hypothetical protein